MEIAMPAVDSELLSDDITHALGHSWFFDPKTITLAIRGGAVTLKGTVRSERERKMAAAAAWAEPGVTDVTVATRRQPKQAVASLTDSVDFSIYCLTWVWILIHLKASIFLCGEGASSERDRGSLLGGYSNG
jgi:hypothetical protein